MSAIAGIRMTNPAHPGGFVKSEIIEPLGLSVTVAAQALGVRARCWFESYRTCVVGNFVDADVVDIDQRESEFCVRGYRVSPDYRMRSRILVRHRA